jgi:hypothetical protein
VTVAAFVVAVVALGVSVVAALSAWRSSRAAQAVAGRDADRRHEERTPQWAFTIETTPDTTARYRLVGRLTSSEAVDSVQVKITEGEGVCFTNGQDGVSPEVPFPLIAEGGPVTGGAAVVWTVAVSLGPSRTIRLTVRSTRDGDKPWETPETTQAPRDVSASFW